MLAAVAVLLGGCVRIPEGVEPVQGFEVERYLGKWYEIARLDHPFERGLSRVTAEYALGDEGGVLVTNRGYLASERRWKEANGTAYFVRDPDTGYLKVSFFGPFYGAYVIFELDREDYAYSFVTGPNKSYLWFLSRTPTVSDALRERFVERARALGYDTSELIFVDQSPIGG